MRECSKSISRRLANPAFLSRYFVGDGLDIGGLPDPLSLYCELFPLMRSVRVWDRKDGDGQHLASVADDSFDFVHSSHCLEHLNDPREGLSNWLRVVRPGGYLIVTVPDEDLYEQGVFPSTFNTDHKWTFTICKSRSWSSRSLSILDLLIGLQPLGDVERVELLSSTYRFALPRYDQTLTPVAESGIEFVIRKRSAEEAESGARARPAVGLPKDLNKYFNQYRSDQATLKRANEGAPPFQDDSAISD
jgi:SAM-dependent methyltransferase